MGRRPNIYIGLRTLYVFGRAKSRDFKFSVCMEHKE